MRFFWDRVNFGAMLWCLVLGPEMRAKAKGRGEWQFLQAMKAVGDRLPNPACNDLC